LTLAKFLSARGLVIIRVGNSISVTNKDAETSLGVFVFL
jgi:hypothetical protein